MHSAELSNAGSELSDLMPDVIKYHEVFCQNFSELSEIKTLQRNVAVSLLLLGTKSPPAKLNYHCSPPTDPTSTRPGLDRPT